MNQLPDHRNRDAGSGRRLWYADLNKVADDGKQHLVSDVTIAPDGTAYAVDELSPTIFRIAHPEKAAEVRLSKNLKARTAGLRVLPDGSIAAISSGLLSGKAAVVQRVRPGRHWKSATVSVTDTVTDPVSSALTAGPRGTTYALSGGLAALLAGKPNDGFTLRPVTLSRAR
ncbi:hypothetical protein [Nonomuraea sp. MG754425]|uniref:hypothetical protein n=1 Tax=Nonomuraea sp. MG754425 TaxID=2570319 RepID=UPI001F3399AD|nr:hypothetical protein [Nonomuraea sp. MG754425]